MLKNNRNLFRTVPNTHDRVLAFAKVVVVFSRLFSQNVLRIISSYMFGKALNIPLNHHAPKSRITILIITLAKSITFFSHGSVFLLIDMLLILIKPQLF